MTATIGLNTVQGFVDDIKQGGTIRTRRSVDHARAGGPAADDPADRLRPPLRRLHAENARSDTMMLVRLDPDANATTVLSIPRDLQGQLPDPRRAASAAAAKINDTYTDGGEVLTVESDLGPAARPDQPRRQRQLQRLPGSGQRDRLRLRRRRPPVLPRRTSACRRRSSTPRSTSRRAISSCAARRSTTCATATPTPTSCAPRASRTSCARSSRSTASGSFLRPAQADGETRQVHADRRVAPERGSCCGCSTSSATRPDTGSTRCTSPRRT